MVRAFPMNRFMQLLRTIHFNDNSTAIPHGDPGMIGHIKLGQ